MKLIFDTESDGFVQQATQIWCIVTQDVDTNVISKYDCTDPDGIEEGIRSLIKAQELIAHNCIDHDFPLIQKLYPNFRYTGKVFDTMILSQLLFPERPGGHSLEAFGEKLGIQKPEHEDWSRFSPEMLHRCTEDVKINYKVYLKLLEEAYEPIEGVEYEKVY